MTVAALALTCLALLNASMLYYHQYRSQTWLPRQEVGKWRSGATKSWRAHEAQAQAQALGHADYAAASPVDRAVIDQRVDERFPPSDMVRIEQRNEFRTYVQSFGSWQWPLSLAAVIVSTSALAIHRKRNLWQTAPILIIGLIVLADAWYRSYFGALGS